MDTVDSGTSMLLDAQVRPDFTADTAVRAVAQVVQQHGLPQAITIDRDTRFVGPTQQREFPSPFLRFWLCLGVHVTLCPPQRPDKNPFVERYHRSFEYECLRIYRPHTVETATAVTAAYQRFAQRGTAPPGAELRQSAAPRRLFGPPNVTIGAAVR